MKRKVILMITHSSNKTGGGEWDFQRLLEYFHSKGYYIYSVFPVGYQADYFKSLSNEFIVLPDNIFPFDAISIKKYLYFVYSTIQKLVILIPFLNNIKYKIDSCFVNSSACLSEIVALSIVKIPYTISIKEIIMPTFIRKLINFFYRITCREVIVISEYIKNIILDDFNGKKIHIIRSSISNEDLEEIDVKRDKNDNEFIILNSGVITPIKNQEILLKALEKIETDRMVIVNFIGRVEDVSYYEKLLKISKSVLKTNFLINFLGEVTKKQALELECTSDLVVVTSKKEGMSLVVAEALYFKIPVVSTKTGVALEVLNDGYNGFLFDDNDELKLSEIINKFIANPELCSDISKNQLNSYDKYFSYDFYLKEHERILLKND